MLPPEFANAFEFWKRPDKRAVGEIDERGLYAAVGEALSEWELVEMLLGRLFGVLVESETRAAARAYGTIANVNGRRDALLFAGEVYFAEPSRKPHHADLLGILKHYAEASGRRNDIAHGLTTEMIDEQGVSHGFFHVPPEYSSRKSDTLLREPGSGLRLVSDLSMSHAYLERDIRAFAEKFGRLQDLVQELLKAMAPAVAANLPWNRRPIS